MLPVAVPTAELLCLLCVLKDIIDGVGLLCRCLCHIFDHHLVIDEIERFLKGRSGVLDKQQRLHLFCHGGEKLEVVLFVFCHCCQSAIFGTLTILEEPCLDFREGFPLENVGSSLHLQDKNVIFLVICFSEKLKSFLKVSVCLKDHVTLTILAIQCPHFRLHDGL